MLHAVDNTVRVARHSQPCLMSCDTKPETRSTTMSSISNRLPSVTVEYDSRGKRVSKYFTDAYAARKFYINKFREGKNPHIITGIKQ